MKIFSMKPNGHIPKHNPHFICKVHNNISLPALPVFRFGLQTRSHFLKIHNLTDDRQNLRHNAVLAPRSLHPLQTVPDRYNPRLLWSSIFVTLMANKIGGLQFGIYRNCQISSRVFHTAVAALPLTKANRSDFE